MTTHTSQSLKKKLLHENAALVDVGECSLHKVHNAFSHALDSFGTEVETVVVDTYHFFKNSSVQCGQLKEQQEFFGLPEAVFLRHVNCRWLSLIAALDRLLEQISALKSVLSAQSPVRIGGSVRARLNSNLSEKTFYAKALFVKNAGELFTGFLTVFQKREPLVHVLYDELVMLVKKVLGRFLRLEVFQDVSGAKLVSLDV